MMRPRRSLDLELEPFARRAGLETWEPLAARALRVAPDVVERVVVAVRVVVVEDQALHLGLRRDVDGGVDGRVAPCRLEVALEELRVVDERVRALRERDH